MLTSALRRTPIRTIRKRVNSSGAPGLRLEPLKDRLAPAIATWDGGSAADSQWTTAANWEGDAAPNAGDTLVFPVGVPRTTNVNDFVAGTSFGSVQILGDNYDITGNAVVLAGGVSSSGSGNTFGPDVQLSANATVGSTVGSAFTLGGSIDLNGHDLSLYTVDGAGTTLLNAAIRGTGNLTSSGVGESILAASNTYSGTTIILGGTLTVQNGGGLGAADNTLATGTTIANGATLRLENSITVTGERLTFTNDGFGSVVADGNDVWTGDVDFGDPNSNSLYPATFLPSSGSSLQLDGTVNGVGLGNLVFAGQGRTVFNGTAALSVAYGNQVVVNGTLEVNGSLSAASFIQAYGGTLAGSGSIIATDSGQILVSGSVVSPGAAAGTTGVLTLGGPVQMIDSGNAVNVDLNGTTVGTEYDQVNVLGTIDLNSATLNVAVGFTPTVGQTFTILSNDDVDAVVGTFAGLPEGGLVTVGSDVLQISYVGGDGNDVVLTVLTVSTVSLTNSLVTVSPASIQPGDTATVTLQAKDAFGNNETSGGLTVVFALGSVSGGQGTFSSVTDNNDGTYTATFTGTVVGSNTITATIDGSAVTSTAPSIAVSPGPVSLPTSFVSLSLASIQLGGTTTVTLQARDAAGNNLTSGGLSVAFALGSGSGQGTFGPVTDNGDGTYTATFTGGLAGSNTIRATIGGSPVTSAAPSIAVTGAAISLSKSLVTRSLASIQLGGTTTVTLQAKDAAGKKATSGGLTVAFTLGGVGGGQGTFSPVTDNGNGTYTATFTGTVAGSNTIRATIGGSPVTSAAPSIAVTGAAASLSNSTVTLSLASIVAGAKTTITLQAKDAAGNNATSGGLTVAFALGSGSGGQGTFSPVVDNGNGRYTATFTGTTAGSNTITATIGDFAVTSGAPPVTVTLGPVSPANSLVTVAPGSIQSGMTTTVTLQAKDAGGNNLTVGGQMVVFKLNSTTGANGTFGTVTDNGDGTYTATFTGTIAGTNTIKATIGGKAVTSAKPSVDVTPGSLNLTTSVVTRSLRSIQLGGRTQVTLQAKDGAGNKLTTGGLDVAFALGSGVGGQGTLGPVTDNGDGTYTATFTGTVAGKNTIKATIGGSPVTSAAPSVTVTGAAVSLSNSLVTAARSSVGVGRTITIKLQAKDATGKNETSGGLSIAFALANGSGGQGTFGTVTDNQNGTYTATFTATAAGSNTITATIDGSPVTSTGDSISII